MVFVPLGEHHDCNDGDTLASSHVAITRSGAHVVEASCHDVAFVRRANGASVGHDVASGRRRRHHSIAQPSAPFEEVGPLWSGLLVGCAALLGCSEILGIERLSNSDQVIEAQGADPIQDAGDASTSVSGSPERCQGGVSRCSEDNGIQSCRVDDNWGPSTRCVMQTCFETTADTAECVGVCERGARRCRGNGLDVCNDRGEWQASDTCSQSTCVDSGQGQAKCTGVCVEGETHCASSQTRLKRCDSKGDWDPVSPCVASTCTEGVAGSPACRGRCAPTDQRCMANAVEGCDATGEWAIRAPCVEQTCVVEEAGARCVGVCSPDFAACDAAGVPSRCDPDGSIVSGEPCAPDAICRAGTCVPAVHELGTSDDVGDPFQVVEDFVFFYRLPPVEHAARLESIAVIGGQAGTLVRALLYADDGTGTAPGGALVAMSSGGAGFPLIDGERARPGAITTATGAAVVLLSAGTYWLGVVAAEPTFLRGDLGAGAPLFVSSLPFNAPVQAFSSAPPPGVTGDARDLTVFITVRDLE